VSKNTMGSRRAVAISGAAIVLIGAVVFGLVVIMQRDEPVVSAWRTDPQQSGCRPGVYPTEQDPADVNPLNAGQPAVFADLSGVTPQAAQEALLEQAICHTFRYMTPYPGVSRRGYSEVWCAPPPVRKCTRTRLRFRWSSSRIRRRTCDDTTTSACTRLGL
jgi:hypothetical protein